MSSLFRSSILVALAFGSAALGTLVGVTPARAQQTAFVPWVEASADWATNRTLHVPAAPNSEDYSLVAGGDLLRRSPVSEIDLRPLITVQGNSRLHEVDNLEALVDLVSDYRTLRGQYSFNAEYHRQDAYNSQYGYAPYNPLNPNPPDTVGGTIVTGITKTSYEVAPSASYDLTQRVSVIGSASFDAVRYSTDIPQQLVSYNSPAVEVDLAWALSPNSKLGVGPYYTYYDPINSNEGAVKDSGYGVNVSYNYKSSALSQSRVTLRVERDSSSAAPGIPSSTATTWGFEWVGNRRFLTNSVQYSIGRFLQPSSDGGRTAVDQFRVQDNKRLSERLSLNVAVRATRSNDVGNTVLNNTGNRDHANAQASLAFLLTPVWVISGGYRFAYQKVPYFPASAHSNIVFITVGYHGQQPPGD
jgi:hypothetical protein